MAAYAATVTGKTPVVARIAPGLGVFVGSCDVTNYNATLAEITSITKKFRSDPIVTCNSPSDNGYLVTWDATGKAFKAYYPSAAFTPSTSTGTIDDNNDAATLGHALYVIPQAAPVRAPAFQAESSATGLVTDSDTAATEGVAVYIVVDDANFTGTYQLGHFEFVSPTDANGTCTVATGADTLTLFDDDDAATNGVVIRAVAAGGGIEATTGATKDILVPTSTGKFIHVNHATTGSTPTVYFDEDAANTYERLRAVVVDNANEPYKLFVNSLAATEDIPPAGAMANNQLASIVTVGPKPFTYAVGSGGPEVYIASRPDAASLPGAVALYVQAAAAGFNAANHGGQDLLIPTSTGEFVRVTYAASPAGVVTYGYPEGATSDLTILAVVVDNADETYTTESGVGYKRDSITAGASSEVANDVDIGVVHFQAMGIAP